MPELTLEGLVENFEFLDDWMDRYRYLIELGRALPELPAEHRVDANLVRGCQSQVWLVCHGGAGSDAPVVFEADSDAHIVRGLVAVLLLAFSGRAADQIVAFDHQGLFERLGLTGHLSQSRTNGLFSMVARIKTLSAR